VSSNDKISLKEHFNMRMDLMKELSDLQFRLNQTAVDKAESLMERYNNSLNERPDDNGIQKK
jgi:hypothetical protein